MDANKLRVLQDLGYSIHPTCRLCKHSRIAPGRSDWGTCRAISYPHAKHTGPERELSINLNGTCPRWEADQQIVPYVLGSFEGFLIKK